MTITECLIYPEPCPELQGPLEVGKDGRIKAHCEHRGSPTPFPTRSALSLSQRTGSRPPVCSCNQHPTSIAVPLIFPDTHGNITRVTFWAGLGNTW